MFSRRKRHIPPEIYPLQNLFVTVQKSYQTVLVKAHQRNIITPETAKQSFSETEGSFHQAIMTYESLKHIERSHHIMSQYFPQQVLDQYDSETLALVYRTAMLRRLALSQELVQKMVENTPFGKNIAWDIALYKKLLWGWHYFPTSNSILSYDLDSWGWIDDSIAPHVHHNNVAMYSDSLFLRVCEELGTHLHETNTSLKELLSSSPPEWIVPLFWDGEVQHDLLGVTTTDVNHEHPALTYGIFVTPRHT